MKTRIMQLIKDACALTEKDVSEDSEIKLLSLDSLSFIGLIVSIETEFDIVFDDEQLSILDYVYVKDLITTAEELKNGRKENS